MKKKIIVKICGITNTEDAIYCCRSGADVLGFVFAKSPRNISGPKARLIIEKVPRKIKKIGVFVDQDKKVVENIAKKCALDMIQLHGNETPEYCDYFIRKGFKVIKAFRVKDRNSIDEIEKYRNLKYILLDCHVKGKYGGTGKVFDWKLALNAVRFRKRIFISGGLDPENVASAIEAVKPYAVDASSRLETCPGKKDHTAVKQFITAARNL